MLPYDALGEKEKAFCDRHNVSQEDCMLELGINNVLGMRRTDTLYHPQDPRIESARECQDPTLPCMSTSVEF